MTHKLGQQLSKKPKSWKPKRLPRILRDATYRWQVKKAGELVVTDLEGQVLSSWRTIGQQIGTTARVAERRYATFKRVYDTEAHRSGVVLAAPWPQQVGVRVIIPLEVWEERYVKLEGDEGGGGEKI